MKVENNKMSMTEIIDDMTQEMVGSDGFEKYMNAPLPHNNQAYVQRDYKTDEYWIHCPVCGKKQFKVSPKTKIERLQWICKNNKCKSDIEINV